MKKQRESGADLRICVKARNQRFGGRMGAEQRIRQVGLGGYAQVGESFVVGEAADERVQVPDVAALRSMDAKRTRVRYVATRLLRAHNGSMRARTGVPAARMVIGASASRVRMIGEIATKPRSAGKEAGSFVAAEKIAVVTLLLRAERRTFRPF
jgi:hypothetical protein